MIKITPALTPELERHIGTASVAHADAYEVATYGELMRHVARLSYQNKDYVLYFRGQSKDYRNKSGASSIYPSIYRGDNVSAGEVQLRFDLLARLGRDLAATCERQKVEGARDLRRRPMVQWAVLQHYEVTPTPFVDFTQSLRVACSFAQLTDSDSDAYVFVVALPHLSNRISVNSEHDLVTVRLLSICPPAALRPYFQEGYLAGTADITVEYNPKSELDFNRRLVAKFRIPNRPSFWGSSLTHVPASELYPDHDSMLELCRALKLANEPGQDTELNQLVGEYLAAWTAIEQRTLELAQWSTGSLLTNRQALRVLADTRGVKPEILSELNDLREIRNRVAHPPSGLSTADLRYALEAAARITQHLQSILDKQRRGFPKSRDAD